MASSISTSSRSNTSSAPADVEVFRRDPQGVLELADGSAGRCPLVKSDNAKAVSNRRGWAVAGVASACRTGADAALEVAAGGASSDPAVDGEVSLTDRRRVCEPPARQAGNPCLGR